MTETAPVPETPTNPVKPEPAAATAAATTVETEGPASGDASKVKQEDGGAGDAAAAAAAKPEAASAAAVTDAAAAVNPEAEAVKKEASEADAGAKTEVKMEMAAEAPAGEPDLGKIRGLLEFYFGDHNYRRDKFMQGEAAKDPEGAWVMGVGVDGGVGGWAHPFRAGRPLIHHPPRISIHSSQASSPSRCC